MSFRFSSSCSALLVVAFLLASTLPSLSAPGTPKSRKGSPILTTEPGSSEVITNLNQMNNRRDGLRQLEEELSRPFQSFSPKSSMDGVLETPVRPQVVAPSKRERELLERRKNWVWMSPNDLTPGLTEQDMFNLPEYGPDGLEKKKLSAFERFYENLSGGPGARMNRDKDKSKPSDFLNPNKSSNSWDDSKSDDDTSVTGNVSEREHALKKLLRPERTDGFAPQVPHSSFSDIFGLGEKTLTREELLEHKKYMDDYHSFVDSSWQPPANPLAPLGADPISRGGALQGLTGARRDSPAPALGVGTPGFALSPAAELSYKSLGTITPAAPKVEAPKITPPRPNFNPPQRPF